MLNYNKLSKKFDALIASKSKEDIESWLRMDDLRERAQEQKLLLKKLSRQIADYKIRAELTSGDTLFVSQITTENPYLVESNNIFLELKASESNYAMAA